MIPLSLLLNVGKTIPVKYITLKHITGIRTATKKRTILSLHIRDEIIRGSTLLRSGCQLLTHNL